MSPRALSGGDFTAAASWSPADLNSSGWRAQGWSSIGLDGALKNLAHNAYGPVLLGVMAAGLIGFALYSVADPRYRKI